jgi:hypothetical protein
MGEYDKKMTRRRKKIEDRREKKEEWIRCLAPRASPNSRYRQGRGRREELP